MLEENHFEFEKHQQIFIMEQPSCFSPIQTNINETEAGKENSLAPIIVG